METAELISALKVGRPPGGLAPSCQRFETINAPFIIQKTRLNISEIAMPVAAVPVAAAAPAAPAAPAEAAAPAEKAPEKASFTIKLESFAADAKAKVIREIKNIVPGINLVDVSLFESGSSRSSRVA